MATLTSPLLPFQFETPYRLMIETRHQGGGAVERYPYMFWVDITEAGLNAN